MLANYVKMLACGQNIFVGMSNKLEKRIIMQIYIDMAAAKRRDPNYMQLTGDVKKELGLKFKAMCTLNQLAIGEGLEQAITLWLEQQQQESTL